MRSILTWFLVLAVGVSVGAGIPYVVNHHVDDAQAAVFTVAMFAVGVVVGWLRGRNEKQ